MARQVLNTILSIQEIFGGNFMSQDMVNHPSHYNQYTQEVIDTITEWVKDYSSVEGYYIGTVLKYLARAPYKGKKLEDLKKASFYLQEAIEYIEKSAKKDIEAETGLSFLLKFLGATEYNHKPNSNIKMDLNNTDKLMESIKNGTYSSKIQSEESKVMESIRNGTYSHGSKGDKLMQDIKNGTVDFNGKKYD